MCEKASDAFVVDCARCHTALMRSVQYGLYDRPLHIWHPFPVQYDIRVPVAAAGVYRKAASVLESAAEAVEYPIDSVDLIGFFVDDIDWRRSDA